MIIVYVYKIRYQRVRSKGKEDLAVVTFLFVFLFLYMKLLHLCSSEQCQRPACVKLRKEHRQQVVQGLGCAYLQASRYTLAPFKSYPTCMHALSPHIQTR